MNDPQSQAEQQYFIQAMADEWARDIRDQCREAGAAFFMKQMGGYPDKHDTLESMPEDLRIREFPQPMVDQMEMV